jgi:hypothetical protein
MVFFSQVRGKQLPVRAPIFHCGLVPSFDCTYLPEFGFILRYQHFDSRAGIERVIKIHCHSHEVLSRGALLTVCPLLRLTYSQPYIKCLRGIPLTFSIGSIGKSAPTYSHSRTGCSSDALMSLRYLTHKPLPCSSLSRYSVTTRNPVDYGVVVQEGYISHIDGILQLFLTYLARSRE